MKQNQELANEIDRQKASKQDKTAEIHRIKLELES
jgi:hypothetical protein